MKKKDKCSLISWAIKDYNEKFNLNYKPIYKSKKDIKSLLKEYPHSGITCWSYCCYGLYQNCWQDPVFEGNWDFTQEKVNEFILDIFTSDLLRKCRNEKRMFWCEKNNMISMIIVARDLCKEDYIITFSKDGYAF